MPRWNSRPRNERLELLKPTQSPLRAGFPEDSKGPVCIHASLNVFHDILQISVDIVPGTVGSSDVKVKNGGIHAFRILALTSAPDRKRCHVPVQPYEEYTAQTAWPTVGRDSVEDGVHSTSGIKRCVEQAYSMLSCCSGDGTRGTHRRSTSLDFAFITRLLLYLTNNQIQTARRSADVH